jgi:hypothetical protein
MSTVDTLDAYLGLSYSTLCPSFSGTGTKQLEGSNLLGVAGPATGALRGAFCSRYLAAPILRGLDATTGNRQMRPLRMDAYWHGTIRNRHRVLEALQKTPQINGLLIEAQRRLNAAFPHGSLILEGDSDGEQLYVVIQTALNVDTARAILSDFDRGWWLENMGPADGNMSVVLELI